MTPYIWVGLDASPHRSNMKYRRPQLQTADLVIHIVVEVQEKMLQMRCWVEAFTIMPVITIPLKRSFYRMASDGGMGNVHMWWMWARVRGHTGSGCSRHQFPILFSSRSIRKIHFVTLEPL